MTLKEGLQRIVTSERVFFLNQDKFYARKDCSTNVKESLPLVVVKVATTKELIEVVQYCIALKQPLVIRAAGTGKTGGAIAGPQSVLIDITALNKILSIDKENLLAEVEPGVVLMDLKKAVKEVNLFYPPDPASSSLCTLGGNVAENAAGPSTIKYGSTKDYLLGGQAILGTGEIIDFGKRCPKGVAGYDIASLLCGSEGSLAVFTKLILRLLPCPSSFAAALYFYLDEEEALSSINRLLGEGFRPMTLEYIDHSCLIALKNFTDFDFPKEARAALIVECDAHHETGASLQIHALTETIKKHAKISAQFYFTPKELEELWQMRSLLSEACSQFLGNKLSEDIAVPLGKLLPLRNAIKKLEASPHLLCGLFGHAGDGNLHVQIMFDDKKLETKAQALRHEILLLVLALQGTIAAEHGIGLQKKSYLMLEQSPALIMLQKRIKQAFDPHNLLNPGKIF